MAIVLTPWLCAAFTPAGLPGARELAASPATAPDAKTKVASAADRNTFIGIPRADDLASTGAGTLSSVIMQLGRVPWLTSCHGTFRRLHRVCGRSFGSDGLAAPWRDPVAGNSKKGRSGLTHELYFTFA